MKKRPLDIVVFGATGFTGRLVAEFLLQRCGAQREFSWAMAGRSAGKLAAVRDSLGAPAGLPLIEADASDIKAMRSLAQRTQVVVSTVGPYQMHGDTLLQACVETGTAYVDLCGEPAWMAQKIAQHQAAARKSGARIVFSCGFDSVPFDLGVHFLQHHALQQSSQPLPWVRGHVLKMKGGYSGGTAASLMATLQAQSRDSSVTRTMADPFALTPGFSGPPQRDSPQAQFEAEANAWSAPFVMAPINTKNVHRSNALLGHAYGKDFVYEERQLMGSGRAGELRARGAARMQQWQNLALGFAPTRALIARFVVPKPGQGPGPQERESGHFELRFSGADAKGRTLSVTVKGDRDPGYGSTSKMISECALCLVQDPAAGRLPGGLWTPASALGMPLVERLQARAGLSFELDLD